MSVTVHVAIAQLAALARGLAQSYEVTRGAVSPELIDFEKRRMGQVDQLVASCPLNDVTRCADALRKATAARRPDVLNSLADTFQKASAQYQAAGEAAARKLRQL